MLEPVGTVIEVAEGVTCCQPGDEIWFSNTETVIKAPDRMGERIFIMADTDILAVLIPAAPPSSQP